MELTFIRLEMERAHRLAEHSKQSTGLLERSI
jgi:hypothetical protein